MESLSYVSPTTASPYSTSKPIVVDQPLPTEKTDEGSELKRKLSPGEELIQHLRQNSRDEQKSKDIIINLPPPVLGKTKAA